MDFAQEPGQGRVSTIHDNFEALGESIRGTGTDNGLWIPDCLKDVVEELI